MIRTTALDQIELGIVITTSNHNPELLSLEFLKSRMIVPDNWKDGQQVLSEKKVSQVIFSDRVNIIAHTNRITFIENLDLKALSSTSSPTIALRYTDALPALIDINYFSVNIIFKGYILFPENSDLPHKYIFQKLVRPPIEEWTEINISSLQGSVNLFYSFIDKEFKLSIDEATLTTLGKNKSPILLFTGNFNYSISDQESIVQNVKSCQVILDWFHNLEIYRKIVDRFLNLD